MVGLRRTSGLSALISKLQSVQMNTLTLRVRQRRHPLLIREVMMLAKRTYNALSGQLGQGVSCGSKESRFTERPY
jgi:hypothetical protein